jgi:hypothetical protein
VITCYEIEAIPEKIPENIGERDGKEGNRSQWDLWGIIGLGYYLDFYPKTNSGLAFWD